MSNIIMIDSSYTSFYRFFATKTWYSMAHKDEFKKIKDLVNYDWLSNKIFIEKYEKMYLDSVKKLVGAKVFKDSIIIFARDPPQSTIWRNNMACNYKAGRQDLTQKNNFKPVFKYTYNKLIPQWVDSNDNMFVFKEEEIEADDIIAISTKYVKENYPNKNIYIVSGDEDFLQLGDKNVYFVHYKKKTTFQLTKIEAYNALIKKIADGDCSDNISSIFKGKRIKNKKEMLENPEKLFQFIDENSEFKKNFKHNQKLIDFNFIPKKYQNKLNKKLKKLF